MNEQVKKIYDEVTRQYELALDAARVGGCTEIRIGKMMAYESIIPFIEKLNGEQAAPDDDSSGSFNLVAAMEFGKHAKVIDHERKVMMNWDEFRKVADRLRSFCNRWISVKHALPPVDKEVIVLSDNINGKTVKGMNRLCFAHIVDRDGWDGTNIITGKKSHYVPNDYNGWSIPGVHHWIPCPPIEGEDAK